MRYFYLYFFFCVYILSGCSKDEICIDQNENGVVNDTMISFDETNKWILKTMKLYYYWADKIPNNLDSLLNVSPDIFFKNVLFKDDRFSWISQNNTQNYEILYGKQMSKGFESVFLYSDSTMYNILGEVIYTYPNSLAEKQGIKRGFIFDTIDGKRLNVDNYKELLNSDGVNYNFMTIRGDSTIDTTSICIINDTVSHNPILCSKTIPYGVHKIGYISYKQFICDDGDNSEIYKQELKSKFVEFKNNNIDNLVIDLRYNTGGDLGLCVYLGSMIVPRTDSLQIALKIKYNDKLSQAYYAYGLDNTLCFEKDDECYIGDKIDKIIILTGRNTASASENLINMLLPYKKVVLVGDVTYGKNYASQVFASYNPNINYVIQPIVMKVFNSVEESEFDNGFKPDYFIDEIAYPLKEFGSYEEPLLQKALEVINGDEMSHGSMTRMRKGLDRVVFKYSIINTQNYNKIIMCE